MLTRLHVPGLSGILKIRWEFYIPWKKITTFFASLLPIQYPSVSWGRETVSGSNPRFFMTAL